MPAKMPWAYVPQQWCTSHPKAWLLPNAAAPKLS